MDTPNARCQFFAIFRAIIETLAAAGYKMCRPEDKVSLLSRTDGGFFSEYVGTTDGGLHTLKQERRRVYVPPIDGHTVIVLEYALDGHSISKGQVGRFYLSFYVPTKEELRYVVSVIYVWTESQGLQYSLFSNNAAFSPSELPVERVAQLLQLVSRLCVSPDEHRVECA